jgi:endonuclease YncB( thermonuclease family)
MPAFLIVALLGLFVQIAPADPVVVEGGLDATVNQVIDGMTLDAQIDGIRTPVAYLGVQTPALNQRCGPEAAQRNRELAGTHVVLAADPAYDLDQQHRRLYYAFTVDGVSIDETLVAEGLAQAAHPDAANGAHLQALQAAAQSNAVGCLWS